MWRLLEPRHDQTQRDHVVVAVVGTVVVAQRVVAARPDSTRTLWSPTSIVPIVTASESSAGQRFLRNRANFHPPVCCLHALDARLGAWVAVWKRCSLRARDCRCRSVDSPWRRPPGRGSGECA